MVPLYSSSKKISKAGISLFCFALAEMAFTIILLVLIIEIQLNNGSGDQIHKHRFLSLNKESFKSLFISEFIFLNIN
jgi:hypothetical protein